MGDVRLMRYYPPEKWHIPSQGTFEDDVPFRKVGYVSFPVQDMPTECQSHETLRLSNPPVGTTIEELIIQSGAAETGQISMAFGRLQARLDHF